VGGVLGGAGIGVSAHSANRAAAADFAAYVCSAPVQAGRYAGNGGQPGHLAAWSDTDTDRAVGGFFSGTLDGIRSSYLRPRWNGYLPAQTAASEHLHDWLRHRSSSAAALSTAISSGFAEAARSSR
jgi:multiple sugar transport system substrate-binding protein